MRVIAESIGGTIVQLPKIPKHKGKKKASRSFRKFRKRMILRLQKVLAEMSATPSHAGTPPAGEKPTTSSKKEVRMVTRPTSIRQKVNHVAGAHRF